MGVTLLIVSDHHDLDCSVVVPSYRGAHRLARLLPLLDAQDFGGSWEVVVVLDGPDPSSEQVLEAFAPTFPLRVVARPQNGGVAAAMQDGVEASRGRIVIRCDDDLAPPSDHLTAHMRHHHGSAVGVIAATRDVFDDTPYARAYGRRANARSLRAAYARQPDELWIGWAANNSVPRAWVDRVGGFDSSLWYGEDSELGYRLHEAGLSIVIDPSLEIEHHGPATSTESRASRAFVSGASKAAFQLRHPGVDHAPERTKQLTLAEQAWKSSVLSVSRLLRSRRAYAGAGRCVDVSIRVLPSQVSEKLIAMLVEAAGAAGKEHGQFDLSVFSVQKEAEVAREVAQGALPMIEVNDPNKGISVIIPHYGDSLPTRRLVEMLAHQRDSPELQVIVVDDHSPVAFPDLGNATVVRREENGGYGSAINTGAKLAVHDTILILNSDLEIEKHFVHDFAAAAGPHMPAVVSPDIVDEHGLSQRPARHFPTARQQFVAALSVLARFRHSNWWQESVGHDTRATGGRVVDVDWVVGAVLMLPTKAFRQVHGFDEGFFMNSEEIDLQRRLRGLGLRSVFVGTVRAVHEGGGSSDPSLRRTWLLSSALLYAKKWDRVPVLHRIALASAALINFPVNAIRSSAGRDVDAAGTLRRELAYAWLPLRKR